MIQPGQNLAHYEIVSAIGKGGMGEVWRARDHKLGREVAIKTLPEEFATDEERLARFEREAKLLAALNHPNIATIHGLEEDNDTRFLVLELVEGDTLVEFLAAGPLPVESALNVALQVAEGLEAAHENGIIHRDLKPANIKVTPDGKVKVLDFGLGKAVAGETPRPDLSTRAVLDTKEGIIQGTPAYMSPQQARGEVVDKRTDVWAFGCVLYELLAGRRPFHGETLSDTLAKILESEPDWNRLPSKLNPKIEELLRRCLEKNPKRRWQAIGDVRLEIENLLADASGLLAQTAAVELPTRAKFWQIAPWLVASLVVGATIAAVVTWQLTLPVPERRPQLSRFAITPPPATVLAFRSDPDIAISPDGSRIVFAGVTDGTPQLYMHSLDQLVATPIPDTERAHSPFFSPDGQWLGFISDLDRTLKKISVTGGSAVTVCKTEGSHFGASWSEDDTIVFKSGSGLARVSASEGTPTVLTTPRREEGETTHVFPVMLPGGKGVVFSILGETNSRLAVLSFETGERKILFEGGVGAQYVPTGHLVYGQGGALWAMPFDLEQLETVGPPVPILEDVMMATESPAVVAFSTDGTLVYLPESAAEIERALLVWVDRQGNEEPLALDARPYAGPRLSPDGRSLAVEIRDPVNRDVWIHSLERDTFTKLTIDPAPDGYPLWTPDGRQVVFSSFRDSEGLNLFRKAADGTGPAERLTTNPNNQMAFSFSPDGKRLVFMDTQAGADVHVLSMEGEPGVEPLLESQFYEGNPTISPDGRWIAYQSNETGRFEVYVRPFPNVEERKWPISSDGGGAPVWGPQGRELFYRSGQEIMVVRTETEPTFTPGNPEVLFTDRFYSRPIGDGPEYDISPDGQRFLMMKRAEQTEEESAPRQLLVVQNWFEELKERVPVP